MEDLDAERRETAPGISAGIHARGLRKSFGDVDALNGLDLDVAPGEVLAMLGQNGAGKSTLLRVLGTTVLPDEGSAYVGGHDVLTDAANARRSTGLVLGDERSWYWRLTGRANLEFFGALYGFRRRERRERATELLELVQLSSVADRRFDGYSSGMRARLSIARALMARPSVLLLDEPTSTLDPVMATDSREFILSIARKENSAVLWVTHDLHEAAVIADRILVVAAGRIVVERENEGSAGYLAELLSEHLTAR